MTTESTPAAPARSKSRLFARALDALATWARRLVRAMREPQVPRGLGRELAPIALPVICFPWLYYCCLHYAAGMVWRDTPMYTYPAWCVLHGERLYSTVSLPDGPLAVLIHIGMLLFGGMTEQGWRHFDLGFHLLVGAAIGALLAPRSGVVTRLTWAAVGLAVWLTALMSFDFPASTQREAYYNGMGMLGVALVFASADYSRRWATWMISAGAVLAGLTFWGKQTAWIYAALVIATALLLPQRVDQPRWWRFKWVVIGGVGSTVAILAWVAAVGSLRGMWFWFFRYNVEYYRFHEIVRIEDILSKDYARDAFSLAGLALVGGVTAIAFGALPRRAIAFAIAPALEVASAIAQHRGWRYHFIPAVFCAGVFFVVALAHAWGPRAEDPPRRVAQATGAIVLASFLGWWSMLTLTASPWLHESEEHRSDGAATDPHAAAGVIMTHTRSDDRVFLFGDNPAVLLFAQRHPATEFIVPWMFDLMKHVPTGGDMANVRALQAMNEKRECDEVLANPPPALVFQDHSVGYGANIQEVFLGMCPAFRPVMQAQYHQVRSGPYHIYVRNDRP